MVNLNKLLLPVKSNIPHFSIGKNKYDLNLQNFNRSTCMLKMVYMNNILKLLSENPIDCYFIIVIQIWWYNVLVYFTVVIVIEKHS